MCEGSESLFLTRVSPDPAERIFQGMGFSVGREDSTHLTNLPR